MLYEMLKPFDDESFALLKDNKIDSDQNQENSNVESKNYKLDFIYNDEMSLAEKLYYF